TARRELNSASEDPGDFTISGHRGNIANTVAIQPESAVAPTVTTQAVSGIAKTTATGNGTITDTGGENCDKRGIVYDTQSHGDPGDTAPGDSDYADYEEENGSFGTGAFTRSLEGLTHSTPYYARAYAHNSAGYSYGSQVEFITTQVVTPSSIASQEAFGDPTVVPGGVVISPSAIASLEAFGDPTILPGVVIISPSAIASLEAFGTPSTDQGDPIHQHYGG
ncbi:unnamed protein product, partial [marine sediment metagenome]